VPHKNLVRYFEPVSGKILYGIIELVDAWFRLHLVFFFFTFYRPAGFSLWLLWNKSLYIAYIFFFITVNWIQLYIFIKNIILLFVTTASTWLLLLRLLFHSNDVVMASLHVLFEKKLNKTCASVTYLLSFPRGKLFYFPFWKIWNIYLFIYSSVN
jgi:hypothetical protein